MFKCIVDIMLDICKILAAFTCIQFWKPARILRCFYILVAMSALSTVIILHLVVNTNRSWKDRKESEVVRTKFRYDNSRKFLIQDSVFVGSDWPLLINGDSSGIVCLATQASIEKFHHVIDSGVRWKGFVSVAVFTPGVEHQIAVIYLQYLTTCFEDLMQNVSIHWVFPLNHPPEQILNLSSTGVPSLDCLKPKEVLEQLLGKRPPSMMSWRKLIAYPQNLMRNVARKSCISDYVLLTDVDIITSPGMCQVLSGFVVTRQSRMCRCCVFVIPTYEIKKSSTLPTSKKELLDMVAKNTARSYRLIAHKPNQAATNVSAWESLPISSNDITSIGYRLPKFKFGYEPFYLSKDNVPPHDERFVGYGHTRNTQVYEMQMAGYEFYVLDNVFLVHPGMARNNKYNSPKRIAETHGSYLSSWKLLYELRVKYAQYKNNSFVDSSLECQK